MRQNITIFILALATLAAAGCTPEIKVPVPDVTVPLPPELTAAVAVLIAGSGDEPSCPPEEHEPEPPAPADEVDNDQDGETEVNWFDPSTIHGDIIVNCPESCTIRMTLANGFKWRWIVPGTIEPVTEFTFAGELLVPASGQAQFEISVGGELNKIGESYVEVGEENLLSMISLVPNNGGKEVHTTTKYYLPGTNVGSWIQMQILHVKKIKTE